MRSVITSVAMLGAVVVLVVSAIRFWVDSREAAKTQRRLAALSSMVTLLLVAMIYCGAFARELLQALQYLHVSPTAYEHWRSVLRSVVTALTDLANTINVFTDDVGYRPDPPLWPAVLLALGYTARFAIYRSHTRKGNVEAAITGSVYWCHLTAYAMAVSFCIVVVGWSAALVIPVSLLILGAFIVSLKLLIEDAAVLARSVARLVRTLAVDFARWIAFIATGFAASIRKLVSYASKMYVEKVRAPLRARLKEIDAWSAEKLKKSGDRLVDQNTKHQRLFGEKSDTQPPE